MMWWIEKGVLAGSHNPSDRELSNAAKLGITTVISLLDETEQVPAYSDEIFRVGKLQYRHSISVRDYSPPSIGQLMEFIAIVRESAGAVLVHCQGGSGRTGTFGAAWLISKGFSADGAIRAIREMNPRAVETAAQEECLWTFSDLYREKSSKAGK
ncbi:MAG: dual specificity protein phosphatase family protein [Candidatus Fermentibacteria bacterium]